MPGTERLRMLFINHWAARLGGAEHSLLDLLEEAARDPGVEVSLLTAEQGELTERASALGVSCRSIQCSPLLDGLRREKIVFSLLRNIGAVFSFFSFVLEARRHIASVKPDLVHANVPKSHITLALLARLGYRGACCYHLREIFRRQSLPYLLYAFLLPVKNASVIAISKAVRDSLPFRLRKIARVEYNGVQIKGERAARTPDRHALRFVYLGRVVPWKGCHLLIEAFSLLYKKYGAGAGTLDIIGDTMYWDQSYRDELTATIRRLGLEPACRLFPHTAEPLALLADHDVFCIASDQEPFGRVVAEAQGCGLPVIGFANGGLPEIVEHNRTGLLVPPGDVAAFAAAMETLRASPDTIVAMSQAAVERADRMFNRSVQVRKIVEFLIDSGQANRQGT